MSPYKTYKRFKTYKEIDAQITWAESLIASANMFLCLFVNIPGTVWQCPVCAAFCNALTLIAKCNVAWDMGKGSLYGGL